MVNYGLTDRVAIVTGANNPWGIGATTALAFAREDLLTKVKGNFQIVAEAKRPH